MKNKKGFTLVELIGTFVILAIIFGLVVIAYVNISNNTKKVYYTSLEESIKSAAVEYYTYNKIYQPTSFGNQIEVSLDTLINNEYISDVKDQRGNNCDLSRSKGIAYRTSNNKIQYEVCLVCDDYQTDNNICNGIVDYTMKMTATIGNTGNLYKDNTYSNQNVVLNFKSQNDIHIVELYDENNNLYKTCNIVNKDDIKSCKIEVETTGNYKAIGKASNGNQTSDINTNILIDKNKPTFDIYSSNRTTLISNQNINLRLSNENNVFYVLNMNDIGSGFNNVSYSLEKKDSKPNYVTINKSDDLTIEKKLTEGIWELVVIVRDKASNETKKTVQLNVQLSGIDKNSLVSYCKNNLVYNGTNQTLTSGTLEGVEFYNNTGKDAKTHQVSARLLGDNRWDDNTTEDATFYCTINPKSVSNLNVTLEKTIFEYTGTEIKPNATVKDGETILIKNEDYTISYANNINIGTATATITYIGNYSGTDSKPFTIIKATPIITLSETNKVINIDELFIVTASTNTEGVYEIINNDNTIVENIPDETATIEANESQDINIYGSSAGTATLTVNFIPTDTTNFNSTEATITVIVRQRYCAEFDINGAEEIGSDELCCQVTSGTSCEITLPSITPIEKFDVLGWNANPDATTATNNVNTSFELTDNTTLLYAITKSKDSEKITRAVTFNLNGATSMTYEENTYTDSQTFSCTTSNVYNGDPIPTSCELVFPSLERENGDVYGWDEDSTNRGVPTYQINTSYDVKRDMDLYGISSKDITISYNGNGGETTLTPQTEKAYNNSSGAWFDIPAYDNKNMCRAKNSDFYGYKYAGLATSSGSSTINACQGDKVYLTDDTTYYAVWRGIYAYGTVTTNLNVRSSSMESSSNLLGTIRKGGKICIRGGTTYKSGNTWRKVKWGSQNAFAVEKYISNIVTMAAKSCDYNDYVCASNNNYLVSVLPDNILLNFFDNTTSKQLTVETTCGDIVSVVSSDNSLVTSTGDGLVTAVDGSVAVGETKTATITYTAEGECSTVVNVTVKNINMTPPTISMTVEGTNVSDGYQTDTKVTATCNSPSGISSFNLIGGNNLTTPTITETQQIKMMDLDTSGVKKATATCVAANGLEATVSNTYKIYQYSVDSSCSCKTYKSCTTSGCGVKSTTYTYSGNCTCYFTGGQTSVYCSKYKLGSSSACESKCKSVYGSNYLNKYSSSCSYSTSKTYKYCENSACGCSVRNACWHT